MTLLLDTYIQNKMKIKPKADVVDYSKQTNYTLIFNLDLKTKLFTSICIIYRINVLIKYF